MPNRTTKKAVPSSDFVRSRLPLRRLGGASVLVDLNITVNATSALRPLKLPENMLLFWTASHVTTYLGVDLRLTHQDESFTNTNNFASLPSYTRVDAAVDYDVSGSLVCN